MFDPSRDGCAMLTRVAISTSATVWALASAFIKIKGLDLEGDPSAEQCVYVLQIIDL